MNEQIQHLVERIRSELNEVERALLRIERGWQRANLSADDYYLDSVALNLHGFYNGLERIFERIAAVIDGHRPTGTHWHQALLDQMSQELPGVRPPVLSDSTHVGLSEYRGFRHVVRNVYTFNFDPIKIGKLVTGASFVFSQVRTELLAFAEFLEEQE